MKQAFVLVALPLIATAQPVGSDLTKTLHGIEEHYNNIKTLRVNFTETLVATGGRHKPQSGTLYLKKPGRMRWEYTAPPGKLFLSDGEFTYDYDPLNNRVDKRKLKEADDMRGPLAFLLGKLDFSRDFDKYETSADGAITAIPKNPNLPYSEVTFRTGPDFSIQKLSVKGAEGVLDYMFDGEQRNPPLMDSLFKFVLPAGAVLIDDTRGNQ